jgi:hypothetical protein
VEAEVIQFPKKKEKPKMVFYCTHCLGDVFVIQLDGGVHCGNCTAFMRNLSVNWNPPEGA